MKDGRILGACTRKSSDLLHERAWGIIAAAISGSRQADTNFYARSSRRRIRLQADVIINRIVKTLLAPEVSLRRLN
jgi:hypothetical protein